MEIVEEGGFKSWKSASGPGPSASFTTGDNPLVNPAIDAFTQLGNFRETEVESVLLEKRLGINWCTFSESGESQSCFSKAENLLGKLKDQLNSEKPGQQSQEVEIDFVKAALEMLSEMYMNDLLTEENVRGFFRDNRTIKTVGKHVVHVYGEEYPSLSMFKNFKPDIEFLKRDPSTSHLHWFLENSHQPGKGEAALEWRLFLNADVSDKQPSRVSSQFLDCALFDHLRRQGCVGPARKLKPRILQGVQGPI
ncbi:hypothetical protein PTTG_26650 [Puccinia triticina 1-1 BBBD Race 1]|uniref:Uncharacterized protein n=1 Tax=Puccinia triticina (isolate 1-1 / race 1 (BBBD)) TaxID=630390 RepID=A0A180GT51_PUCT1|nr:hypothetical protein PTTG_26650 [Puccinia triticina 1-1 BBBD Race 1]